MFCKNKRSQISQDNACVGVSFKKQTQTQVFSCEICKIFKNTCFEKHLRTTASKHRSIFVEVFRRRMLFSALINTVMKYSFSAVVVQSRTAIHANLLKIALHRRRYFSRNFTKGAESGIEKCILMATSEDEFFFGNIPAWLLLKGSCKRTIHFKNYYKYFTFLTLTSC